MCRVAIGDLRCELRIGAYVHDIERLLKAGCTLELAWTIMRPVDKPPVVASAAADPAD